MANNWKSGLDDEDELEQFPSASSPLTAAGIDPDKVRANPAMLESLRGSPFQKAPSVGAPPVDMPQSSTPKPSPSATAAGALGGAGETEPTDEEGFGRAGLSMLYKNAQNATRSADEMSTTTPPELQKLTERRDKLALPAPLFDPKTGQRLTTTKEYDPDTGQMVDVNPKASTASKVWRGVRGGLTGLTRGGVLGAVEGAVDPKLVGATPYNAPSDQYRRAEERRAQALSATNADIDTAFKTWKDINEARKTKAGEFRANAALGKDLTTGATGLINAENKPESEERKSAAKLELNQKEFDQRGSQADRLGLKGLNRILFMANGKIPDPRQPTEGEYTAQQIANATRLFTQQYGHPPQTLEDMNKIISTAKGDLGKGGRGEVTPQALRAISDRKNAAIEKANADHARRLYQPNGGKEYQRQLQEIQNAYEEDMANIGQAGPHQVVTVDAKGNANWAPEQPAAPAAQPAPAPAAAPPQTKPQPAPDGTRRQAPDGTIEVKKGGKWVKE